MWHLAAFVLLGLLILGACVAARSVPTRATQPERTCAEMWEWEQGGRYKGSIGRSGPRQGQPYWRCLGDAPSGAW